MTMLSKDRVHKYHQDGYLFLEDYYSLEDVELLRPHLSKALSERGARTVLETKKQSIRSVYGVHQNSHAFSKFSRHCKLTELARELLGGDVYIYQSKLNVKAPFDGDRWDWHQDYIYWQREDGMPTPQVLTAMVFLDAVTEFNGPLMMAPGSHREGVLPCEMFDGTPAGYENSPSWIANLTATIKYTLDRDVIANVVKTNGLVAPKGRPGSTLFMHGNTVHASQANISPFPRTMLLITYNRVDNAPKAEMLRRPEFLASRDTRPIQPLNDDLSVLLADSECRSLEVLDG